MRKQVQTLLRTREPRIKILTRSFLSLSIVIVSAYSPAVAQGPKESWLGSTIAYAPDSSHILIGSAEQRRILTVGIDYERELFSSKDVSLRVRAACYPLFQERDPTVVGTSLSPNGGPEVTPITPTRVVTVNRSPIGMISNGSTQEPLYPLYASEISYAFDIEPVGVLLALEPNHTIHPVLSSDYGVIVSSRDLPVDQSSNLNFVFSFGVGVEGRIGSSSAMRVEYLYRHISNANMGTYNPGMDAGVFRISFQHRIGRSQ